MQALDCDFYAFSGHKLYGPTGIGVLYGKAALLEAMPPYQGGGDMIAVGHVREDDLQRRAAQVRGRHAEHRRRRRAGAAIDYVEAIGRDGDRRARGRAARVRDRAGARDSGRCASSARRAHKAGVLSFVLEGVHPHDVGTILDREGIAVRTGHHCASR